MGIRRFRGLLMLYVLALVWILVLSIPLQAYQLDPDRVGDTTFKQDTPIKTIRELHGWENHLLASDSYPQNYEREIVLKLTQRVASETEYQNASDTEKALHWWLDPKGMPIESYNSYEIPYSYQPFTSVSDSYGFTTNFPRKRYMWIPHFGVGKDGSIYIMPENQEMVRKYNKHGEYISTVSKESPKYTNWKDTATQLRYDGMKQFESGMNYQEARKQLGFDTRLTNSPLDVIRRLEQSHPNVSNSLIGSLRFLDFRDSKENLYGRAHVITGTRITPLQFNKLSPYAYLGRRRHSTSDIQRVFLDKYSPNGQLLTEIELLPSHLQREIWYYDRCWVGSLAGEPCPAYIKRPTMDSFYAIGVTYLGKRLDLYLFKYTR